VVLYHLPFLIFDISTLLRYDCGASVMRGHCISGRAGGECDGRKNTPADAVRQGHVAQSSYGDYRYNVLYYSNIL